MRGHHYRVGLPRFRWSAAVALLAIMGALWLLDALLRGSLTDLFGCRPTALARQPWRAFTATFLHAGLFHILFNGLWLFMLGQMLEPELGGRRFVVLMLISGVGGNLSWAAFNWGLDRVAIGASGAVFGGMAAAAILVPHVRVYIWGVWPVKMRDLAIFFVLLETVLSFTTFQDGIAHMAHVGGAFVGLGYVLIDRYVRRPKPPPVSGLPPLDW